MKKHKMKNVRNNVSDNIWFSIMIYVQDKTIGIIRTMARDNIWVNVEDNVEINVMNIVHAHVKNTNPTSSQLQKAFDLL